MKNKHYQKTIKTSSENHKTFTLDNFIVTDNNGEIRDDLYHSVYKEFQQLSELMKKNEEEYYQKHFRNLIKTLTENNENTSGKKNAALRQYIPKALYPPKTQPYNFNEMFRYNIACKTDIYITRYKVEQLIKENPELQAKELRKLYLETYDDRIPTINEITKYIAAYNNGAFDSEPSGGGQLHLSATDGHYRHIESDDNGIHLTIKTSLGALTLHFSYPKKKARYKGKISCPTIRNVNNKLLFDFVAITKRPKKNSIKDCSGVIGVDLGVVNTASWCFVGKDNTYSQPFLEKKRIRLLEDRINKLFEHCDRLREKALACEWNGFFEKADVLEEECRRHRHKITKLKKLKNELVACEIVRCAVCLDSVVAVEDLSWVPHSHWEQSDLQDRLVSLAADNGVGVVKVSAVGSSRTCWRCGGVVRVRKSRRLVCECGCEVDRDVSASRVVGARVLGFDCLSGFVQRFRGFGGCLREHECDVSAQYNLQATVSPDYCVVSPTLFDSNDRNLET